MLRRLRDGVSGLLALGLLLALLIAVGVGLGMVAVFVRYKP